MCLIGFFTWTVVREPVGLGELSADVFLPLSQGFQTNTVISAAISRIATITVRVRRLRMRREEPRLLNPRGICMADYLLIPIAVRRRIRIAACETASPRPSRRLGDGQD